MLISRILIRILHYGRTSVLTVAGRAALAASYFDREATILSNEPGDNPPGQLGPRVVIFCHFDPHGRIPDATRAYIEALCREQLDMVFVTNSRFLAPPDLAWIRARAARVICRRNAGYDFAAWRDGMAACSLPDSNTRLLLIANDSVYGPLRPLGPVLAAIDFTKADVWGATDSWQHCFHLQSFFVAFGPRALNDAAFARFWRSVGNVRSKWWVVRRHELGLAQAFIAAGLRCRALWPYTALIDTLRQAAPVADGLDHGNETARLPAWSAQPNEPFIKAVDANTQRILRAAARRVPLNPTADLWKILIEQGCPFLKREILRKNPSYVPDVASWSSVVRRIDSTTRDLILSDLERSLKNRSP